MKEWIKTSEKLPEENDEILFITDGGMWLGMFFKGKFDADTFIFDPEEASHWQYAPHKPNESATNNILPELVVCAAIKFFNIEDHTIEIIIPSVRHYDPNTHNLLCQLDDELWEELEQGFMTNQGRFVTRQEALKIAQENNQMRCYSSGSNPRVLFSEDLY